MKKLLLLLLLLPLLGLASCGDDNEPNVRVNLTFKNAIVKDNVVYIAEGDTLSVDSLWVEAVNSKHIATVIGNGVNYLIDGKPVARGMYPKFTTAIPTYELPAGQYSIGVVFNVAETDCALGVCATQVPLFVVASASMPDGTEGTPVTL